MPDIKEPTSKNEFNNRADTVVSSTEFISRYANSSEFTILTVGDKQQSGYVVLNQDGKFVSSARTFMQEGDGKNKLDIALLEQGKDFYRSEEIKEIESMYAEGRAEGYQSEFSSTGKKQYGSFNTYTPQHGL